MAGDPVAAAAQSALTPRAGRGGRARAGGRPAGAAAPAAPAAPAERRGVLGQRVVFGLAIGLPVVGGAYLGGPWFLLGAALLGFFGLREFFDLAGRRGARLVPSLGFALGFAVLLVNGGLELLWRGLGPPLG
ncbi:MAG TPA: hypothetical protein VNK05_15220, partial [Chloroflexota bacterium]|nr:hypothetical protein [Chloroflexota bacterium]